MLSGKLTRKSVFEKDDYRNFNRMGEMFDRGETFSGVDYDTGLRAVEKLRAAAPKGVSLSQFALRWILMFPEVSCVIPGIRRPAQIEENIQAVDIAALSSDRMVRVKNIYAAMI